VSKLYSFTCILDSRNMTRYKEKNIIRAKSDRNVDNYHDDIVGIRPKCIHLYIYAHEMAYPHPAAGL